MLKTATLGFPRIGENRELKKAVESHWKGAKSESELQKDASDIRNKNWSTQKSNEISYVPSNDFSFYDQVLDTLALFGAVPSRYNFKGGNVDLELYFSMARGAQKEGVDVTAMEMTKWFDTNYHYIVGEFKKDQKFAISSSKIFDQYKEAKESGTETRPVIIGPVTFLLAGKTVDGSEKLDLLDNLLVAYKELFAKLNEAGVKDVQIDEPYLVTDLDDKAKKAYEKAFNVIKEAKGDIKTHLATYFDDLDDNTDLAFSLGTDSVHVDLVRAPQQLDKALNAVKDGQALSLGLVDGRNIWINDLGKSIEIAKKAVAKLGADRVIIAPSCQLLHSPVSLVGEEKIDSEIKTWLAFATQKLKELAAIAKAAVGDDSLNDFIAENKKANDTRKTSKKIHNDAVKKRAADVTEGDKNRKSDYATRKEIQQKELNLPLLPTTTIGSFPQTKEVRKARADFKKGNLSATDYQKFLEEETAKTVKFQEEIDIDVLVHGEFERNDMVEYFGEQLDGFCFTKNGWVQSYGSRCVKPPVIFGDVSRPSAMTVDWAKYAQSLTKRYMKGMLTGPITILQWSFVRDDQARKDTALQIAFAIRDEVVDLQNAGIKIIQIDEAALREGLPIRRAGWEDYLKWSVDAFRVTASGVEDATQIHTHMCYSEFNDIIAAIANMDADAISIETSRSNMELLEAFINFKYPNDIGPGVYDIHSPRVPNEKEMTDLLKKALSVLKKEQIWVNPDCGLKTRAWPETKQALKNMVDAAKAVRATLN